MEILEKALADSPSRDDARLPFFRAAVSITEDELALASIEQLLQRGGLGRTLAQSIATKIIGADENEAPGDGDSAAPSSLALSPFQQARLAHEVALSMMRVDRLDEAVSYLQVAVNLEKSPAERKISSSQLLELRARLRRQRTNAGRAANSARRP